MKIVLFLHTCLVALDTGLASRLEGHDKIKDTLSDSVKRPSLQGMFQIKSKVNQMVRAFFSFFLALIVEEFFYTRKWSNLEFLGCS